MNALLMRIITHEQEVERALKTEQQQNQSVLPLLRAKAELLCRITRIFLQVRGGTS